MKMTSHSKFLLMAGCVALGVIALGLLLASTRARAEDPAVSAEQMKLAREYVAIVPVEDDIKKAVDELSTKVPPDQRVLYRSIADKFIDYARLRNAATLATAEIFTEAEIKAMRDFYSSPEGKSIREKMPVYEQRMQPVLTEVLRDFVLKLQENNVTLTTQ